MKDRIANITTWSNNCAVSCISVFLATHLLNRTLDPKDAMILVNIMNDAYGTSMRSIGELRFLLLNHSHPCDQQRIISVALRHYLSTQNIHGDHDNMLGDETFRIFGSLLHFNVQMTLFTKNYDEKTFDYTNRKQVFRVYYQ